MFLAAGLFERPAGVVDIGLVGEALQELDFVRMHERRGRASIADDHRAVRSLEDMADECDQRRRAVLA